MRTLLVLLVFAAAIAAQPTPKKSVFEAASIKLGDRDPQEAGSEHSPGRIRMRNATLTSLIMQAYHVKPYQIAGGPKWLNSDSFTIEAKLDESDVKSLHGQTEEAIAISEALRALLAERFQLAFHRETKTIPAYALTVAKDGSKLQKAADPGASSSSWGRGKASFHGAYMESFAVTLSSIVDRPVIDRTGLAGAFDFKLEWAPEDAADSTKPSLFSAIQEQLGLKLEVQRLPVEMLVIDRAEKPGENWAE